MKARGRDLSYWTGGGNDQEHPPGMTKTMTETRICDAAGTSS